MHIIERDAACPEWIATQILEGAIVVLPTSTNYNIFVHPDNTAGIQRIFQAKQRDSRKPLSLCFGTLRLLNHYVRLSPATTRIVKQVLPANVSFICPKRETVPAAVTCDLNTVAIAHQANEFLNEVILAVGAPLAGTSANLSGSGNVREFSTALAHLGAAVDVLIDGGTIASRDANTIIDLTGKAPRIVRAGDVNEHDLNFLIKNLSSISSETEFQALTALRVEQSRRQLSGNGH